MNETDFILPQDKLFSPSIRLTIMILLFTHKKINFTDLQKLLGLTPGNLDHHLKKLERAGYLRSYKRLSSWRKPLTIVELTPSGKLTFSSYLQNFRNILNKVNLSSVRGSPKKENKV